ncbi:MAG TPA: ABC transporter permease [Bryobacteraceae bacterium]|nr:ABC transporter permease [Bryobacteraceae bacterium]
MKTDILFAVRSLRRAPAFFVLAVATLGLGIAANTAIFSLFYQVLLRSLPVRNPQQLVVFHSEGVNLPGSVSKDSFESVFSYPLYLRLKDSTKAFEGLAVRSSVPAQIETGGAAAERGRAEIVSGNYFETLGLRAQAGRLFTTQDDSVRGGNPVAVLSHAFWMTHLGGSASAVNRTVLVNGQPFTVVGIAPENFHGLIAGDAQDIFLPLSMRASLTPGWNWYDKPDFQFLTIFGRLAPGVSRERAEAELQPYFTAVIRDHMDQLKVRNAAARQRLMAKRLHLSPAARGLNALEIEWRKPLFVLLGMVLLLLVIGCANLANLLMARGVNRAREIAVRMALGAGRARVMRLLFTESAILGIVGTAFGFALAPILTRGILRLLPTDELSGWVGAGVNLPILAFSVALMLATTLLFGLIPALQVTRGASGPLGERTQTTAGQVHSGVRKVLVAGQIGLSLVLLAVAGLFGRSLVNLMQHNPGFRADHLLTFAVDPGLAGYNVDRGVNFTNELGRRLAALPGVESTSYALFSPLSHSSSGANVSVEGFTYTNDEDMTCGWNAVGPGYFRTIGTPLLAGREFDSRDRKTKVAIVNQAFQRKFFGARSAVGHKMEMGAGGPLDFEIVGLVQDSDHLSLRETIAPTFFIPYELSLDSKSRMSQGAFFVRASSGFEALPGAVRSAVSQIDHTLPVYALETMEVKVRESVYTDRLIAALATAFGLLAMTLTAVGLYGVIAYLVSRRTAEIGIRMVLGAEPLSIISMILREVTMLVVAGGGIGLLAALGAGRAIQAQLFGMRGADPLVFAGAAGLLAAVALLAGFVPAWRAARVEPLSALRHE